MDWITRPGVLLAVAVAGTLALLTLPAQPARRPGTAAAKAQRSRRAKVARAVSGALRRWIRYWLVEDTGPLIGVWPALTMRRLNLAAAVAAATAVWFGAPAVAAATVCPVAVVGVSRGARVWHRRDRDLRRMFDIAQGALRYPRDAAETWRDWVRVPRWSGPLVPAAVHVTLPAASRAVTDRARDDFVRAWSTTITDLFDWSFAWEHTLDRVVAVPTPALPRRVDLPPPLYAREWNEIPLGVALGDVEVVWDPLACPHALITGKTGMGKSVLQRAMLAHVCAHPRWRVYAIDPKTIELCSVQHEPHVIRYATELADELAALEDAHALMMRRRSVLQAAGAKQWSDLPADDAEPFILIMVDETFNLLSPEKGAGSTVRERNEMKGRCGFLIGEIVRLGRALGVHAVLSTQRPDADVLPGEVKNNCDLRVALGKMREIESRMSLGTDAACEIKEGVVGRAVIMQAMVPIQAQVFFCDENSFAVRCEAGRAIHADIPPPAADAPIDVDAGRWFTAVRERFQRERRARPPRPSAGADTNGTGVWPGLPDDLWEPGYSPGWRVEPVAALPAGRKALPAGPSART